MYIYKVKGSYKIHTITGYLNPGEPCWYDVTKTFEKLARVDDKYLEKIPETTHRIITNNEQEYVKGSFAIDLIEYVGEELKP